MWQMSLRRFENGQRMYFDRFDRRASHAEGGRQRGM
jgi:hypothetical protein